MDFGNEESKVMSALEDIPIEMDEINLGLRGLEDGKSDSDRKRDAFKTPNERMREPITLQRNPMYPG
jgi:hypothetical protein